MPIRNFKPGQTISLSCPSCDGRGKILTRPLKEEAMEDEEKVEEFSVPCTECGGTGRVQGTVQSR